jgi:hypothetical protein
MTRLTLALLMLPMLVGAQDPGNDLKSSLGINFSPDYTYRNLGNKEAPLAKFYNDVEIPSFGYTVGFMSTTPLHHKMRLEGGFMFSNKSYKSKKYSENTDGYYYVNGNFVKLDNRAYSYTNYFIDIPLKANYYFIQSKVKLYATLGIQPGIYLGTRSVYSFYYSDGNTQVIDNTHRFSVYHKMQFGALAGCGLEFNLSSKLYLKFEPIFRYNFTSLSDEAVKQHVYSAGINCGVYFKLN